MLTQICQYLRNWFVRERIGGEFTVNEGVLSHVGSESLRLYPGQYYRVLGSVFNDGVHKWADETDQLVDERFVGAVWALAIPPELITLGSKIEAWNSDNAKAIASPYQSESFGGYSYSLKSGNQAAGSDGGVTWQGQFASQLAPWRKI